MIKMKSLFSFLAICFVVTSFFGMNVGLDIALICIGISEFICAKEAFDKQQKRMAYISLGVGIFVCICSLLSLINVI